MKDKNLKHWLTTPDKSALLEPQGKIEFMRILLAYQIMALRRVG